MSARRAKIQLLLFFLSVTLSYFSYAQDGVIVIEGIRVPDTAEDKVNIWRNARVINNELVPYPDGYTPPKVQIQTFDRWTTE